MMNIKSYLKPINMLIFTLILITAIVFPNKQQSFKTKRVITNNTSPTKIERKIKCASMESRLSQLWDVFQHQGYGEAFRFAKQRAIDMKEGFIRVVLEIDSKKFPKVKQLIQALGGELETSYEELVQTLVPLYSLKDLSDSPEIRQIKSPLKPLLCSIISEGVAFTGADYWQSVVPFHSDVSANVAILDSGFQGYENLLGIELPDTVTARSFRQDRNIQVDKHGTACAEIVHDMAPNAKLWLVNYETEIEFYNAVDYLIDQGVNIISYSMGWANAGAGDGTGPICQQVKKAVNNDLVWISAAGNEANQHWQGYFFDNDGDGWNNFNTVYNFLQFNCNQGSLLKIFLNWNDWGNWNEQLNRYRGSDQDYDLYLYKEIGKEENTEKPILSLLASSSNAQTGTQWPVESIEYRISESGTYYLKIRNQNSSRNCFLELFIRNAYDLLFVKPEGSLLIPADSSLAIAVGGALYDSFYQDSSQGPTSTGMVKPDYCAQTGVSTASHGELGFFGTSAAAAHMAGAFALLKAKTAYSYDQIEQLIQRRVYDLGIPSKDNQYGWGRLKLIVQR